MTKLPTRAEIARLRERWTKKQIKQINEDFAKNRDREAALRDAEREELLDFRGILLNAPLKWNYIVAADLSYSYGGMTDEGYGCLNHTTVIRCRFVGSDFSDLNVRVHAKHCNFDRAKFHLLGEEFEDCSFIGAKMPEPVPRSIYRGCNFTDSDWRKALAVNHVFDNCVWQGCRFGFGSFAGSRFIGTRPDEAAWGHNHG